MRVTQNRSAYLRTYHRSYRRRDRAARAAQRKEDAHIALALLTNLRQRYSLTDISRASGISVRTLQRWSSQPPTLIHSASFDRLANLYAAAF